LFPITLIALVELLTFVGAGRETGWLLSGFRGDSLRRNLARGDELPEGEDEGEDETECDFMITDR
jgi:hypothetical protein